MTTADRELAELLTKVELQEAALLNWGIVDGAWTEEELLDLFGRDVAANDARAMLDDAIERCLIVETPEGQYRTRMAEAVRLLATLRQTFPQQRWWEGARLVADYRFGHRPRLRPRWNRPKDDALNRVARLFGVDGNAALRAVAPEYLSGFQERTLDLVAESLTVERDRAVMVSAGTGSGKTMSFYMPVLAWLADRLAADDAHRVGVVALYPRAELLKDQLRTVLGATRSIAATGRRRPIRVATWFGATPFNARAVASDQVRDWKAVRQGRVVAGWTCPFLTCLRCAAPMMWSRQDIDQERERLTCQEESCGDTVDERFLAITRTSASGRPADVLFTTTESLNRQLAAPHQHRAFGLGQNSLRVVLLDEVHTYEGTTGAQNALLARRLRHAIGRPVLWVGLSATLRNADAFLAEFTNLPSSDVTVTEPHVDELEIVGAEYQIALRHDPASRTGPLSTTIQSAILLARCLDARGTPYQPVPTSGGAFGRKLFVFTDKLDVTNRLFWDILDAEGWWKMGSPKQRRVLTLAHLRAREQSRRPPNRQETPGEREGTGQWWWLPERLGRDLSSDEQLNVGRTSSQDVGVDADADVIVATATLEVGYDDPDVGAVLQHKAPHDAARFVQRRGRAGRDPRMRPWTAVVLGPWGRDRVAWDLYDQLFDPELEPRYLPLRNRYVVRMQAVYATLDWFAAKLQHLGANKSTWADTSAPAELIENTARAQASRRERQSALADLIRDVLLGGPAREQLRVHLRRALGFVDDDYGRAEVDALCWAPPRALLGTVLPTIERRLRSRWAGELPDAAGTAVKTRTPLREFVAGNLFDELMTPEVEVRVPTGDRSEDFNSHTLGAVRTLRELMPGNVTRHFGVSAYSRRHWVAVPNSHNPVLVDVSTYKAEPVASVPDGNGGSVVMYRPLGVDVAVPPAEVRDATSTGPDWLVHVEPLGPGRELTLGAGRWPAVLERIVVHSHALADGARVRRYARRATGVVYASGPAPVEVRFVAGGADAALGVEIDTDALRLSIAASNPEWEPTPLERLDRIEAVIQTSAALPAEMSWVQRGALASGLLTLLATLDVPIRGSFEALDDDALAQRLIAAIGLEYEADPDDDAMDATSRTAASPRDRDASRADLSVSPQMLDTIRLAASAAWSARDDEWLSWWRMRFSATVGAVFLQAVAFAAPDVDTSDLAVDLNPTSASEGPVVDVWITELSPGGNGLIEEIHRTLLDDPKRFARLLDRSVAPGEYELLDEDLRRFLDLACDNADVGRSIDAVRASWSAGHAAVADAVELLREALRGASFEPSRGAWTSIVTRLLGPGADARLPRVARDLIRRWTDVETRVGLEFPSRVFGLVCGEDTSIDDAFRLPAGVSSHRRSRAVENFFWPRGGSVGRIQLDAGDPFSLLPVLDQTALRQRLGPASLELNVPSWDGGVRDDVHGTLAREGYVVLVFDASATRLCRQVIHDLQLHPIDVGALFAYPRVVGLWREQGVACLGVSIDEVSE